MSKNEFICDCNVIHKDVVDSAVKRMPNDDTFNKLTDFLKIMGDKTRAKILWTLDQNEMCVCDIANVLSMSKSSVSHQLKRLKSANIVKYRKDGKEVYYTLDDDHVKKLFELGLEHINHGGDKNEK